MATIHRIIAEAMEAVGTANVLYLGKLEYSEVLKAACQHDPSLNIRKIERYKGLRIERINLESYLQVAYVEGAQ